MAGFSSLFLCQKLVYLIHAVIRFVFSSVFRIRLKAAQESGVLDKDGKKIDFLEPEDGAECGDFGVWSEEEEEDEPEEICLKFKFPTFEEFSKTHEGIGNYSKFERAIVDEMEDFVVKEEIDDTGGFITDGNFDEEFDRTGGGHEEGEEILVVDGDENKKTGAKIEYRETLDEEFVPTGEKGEKIQVFDEKSGAKIEFQENSERKVQTVVQDEDELTDDENHLSSDKISMITDSDSDSTSFERIRSVMTRLVDPQTDGFLSDGDFGVEPPESENEKTETFSELSIFDENRDSSDDFSDEDSDIMDELAKLEEEGSDSKNPDSSSSGFLSFDDFNEKFETNGDEKVEKSSLNDFSEDDDAEEELESLWEHQELIEQLKMELKKVRATGLPTILEESESPKLMEDLKPWKIDEFQREKNCSAGLHKFYKSYREKMRKFDIINYQKMYAMGFLQLKDPMKSVSTHKPSPPTLKSLVSQNLWLFKHKIHGTDPMKKFVQELQGDLEAVYVGQTSLSWEILHWQYEKVLDLWEESGPSGARTYNEVAGEFQQFQVLVQRFLEDEPFQGPRVQNYVKTRCAVRNLLQVPIIREDKRKVRTKATGEYFITTEMLVEMVEESIRIFWRFVRADKDCSIASLNNSHKRTPELSSPEDLELFTELKRSLQKKERKIKDILRSENCILRKFRQCREDESEDQVLYFFSQVDMKLVCRVLNMSKITREQLIWCRNKLNRISFVNRRIHVEPAFLLFPC